MKIVLLCSNKLNQIALANKIANNFNLVGIVVEKPKKKKKRFSFVQIREKIWDRTIFYSIRKAWNEMQAYYKTNYPDFPQTDKTEVVRINSSETIEFIEKKSPDLLMISGTSIVRNEILNLPIPKGIINLHTGLSPYIKGGPNCTNWCIAKNKFHLIGNTIMWIDAGIDSGNIIAAEQTILNGNESLSDLHIKVMEHAHDLYCRAATKIEKDFKNCSNVGQSSIANGTIYYSKDWNWKNKLSLMRNFGKMKNTIVSKKYREDFQKTKIINL
jgi:methionyl-tRNA formyltransferase